MAQREASTFGALLKRYRLQAGLTQEELAERALLSARAISDLERGVNRRARRDTVSRLVAALELTPAECEHLEGAGRAAPGTAVAQESQASSTPPPIHTFLIADVRGYTRYAEERGDEEAARLAESFAHLVERSVTPRGGRLLELRGDEALVIFASARMALEGAVELQSEAERYFPLPLGIGLDAGEAIPVRDGYRGGALNLAARLCDQSGRTSGGRTEVLASSTVIELARRIQGLTYVDRGSVQLKGLARPVKVFQVGQDGALPPNPPPLGAAPVGSVVRLPAELTPFIGRECEIDALLGIAVEPEVRLLTLTGAGGTGKTRIAVQLGHLLGNRFDRVHFVSLAALTDPALLPSAIMDALNLDQVPGKSVQETLQSWLRDQDLLLILDNLEHLLPAAAPIVAELLDACPRLHVLVTSREALHLIRERNYGVPPLALPPPGHVHDLTEIARYDSVALFVQRARAAKADFTLNAANADAVTEICRRVDGLPLGIELAAARIKLFPPAAILRRLESRLQLLTGGPIDLPERHRTLRSTIAWSYALLDDVAKKLFARISVFGGGATLDAVDAVCNLGDDLGVDVMDGIEALVDQNLLLQEGDEEPRFRMLDTIREYALEQIVDMGEQETLRQRHAGWVLHLAEQAERAMFGPEQTGWLERLEAEHDNVRSALLWAVERRDEEIGLRLVSALWRFWQARGHLSEGYRSMKSVLAMEPADAKGGVSDLRRSLRPRVLMVAGGFATNQGLYEQALPLVRESLDLCTELEDMAGRAAALNVLGNIAHFQGNYREAEELFSQTLQLQRQYGRQRDIGLALNNLATVVGERGDVHRAGELYRESLRNYRKMGDKGGIAQVLDNLAELALRDGDYCEARGLGQEGLRLHQELGDATGTANSLLNLGLVARTQGDHEQALSLYVQALDLYVEGGNRLDAVECVERMAGVLCILQEPERAAVLMGSAAAVRAAMRAPVSLALRSLYEADVASVRSALSKDEFARAWTAGEALSLQVIRDSVAESIRARPSMTT